MRKALLLSTLSLLILTLFVSCETVGYYGQAAKGQLSLLLGRQQIDALLRSPDLDGETRRKLQLVLDVREFAEQELQLQAGDSYLSFTALEQPYVLWNVFAAPEFSTEPMQWCYPIAGCVTYRGYFREEAAQRSAATLTSQGLDVYSGGVDAYSTLGWFDDPLTSAVLRRPDHRLVALLFHELAHQRLYLPGDTMFNESFATFVEQEGLRRWLARHPQGGLDAQIVRENQMQEAFVALVNTHREALRELYAQPLSAEEKRTGKQAIQRAMREEYAQLRETWDYQGYDRWFAGPLNNAQLATVASYNVLVPFFESMLARVEGDLARFYRDVDAFTQLPATQREQLLPR
jgi:predicted aminopeptidase